MKLVTGFLTTVTLYDVNSQKISELHLMTNEFGTFSGSFILPQGGLNGLMSIWEKYGQKYFSVEEYKRPTFEVEINKTKGTPKIGESVLVTGIAKAFSGAPIDGATVKYNVVKILHVIQNGIAGAKHYAPIPVTSGETKTNTKGEFEISFTAIPDNSDDPSQNPTYNYSVSIDITDINGETRSATKTVTVGYTALVLNLGFEELVDKNKIDSVPISTTNLEGEFEPAKGEITIYKLQSPEKTYRDRYWEMPDTFIYSEKEFHEKLPNDQYFDENNFMTWKPEKIVQHGNFNTGISKTLQLEKVNKWSPGKYMAELKSTDKFGTEVTSKTYFTLYSSKENKMPFARTDFFDLNKNQAKPGDTIHFLAGTSEKEITILYELEQNGKILKKDWLTIKNSLQKVNIPITEDYSGNISLNYVFVKNGRLYNHAETIQVPYSQKEIAIKFETFRDKLVPGEAEHWLIKLAGSEGEKLAAEMVATMYDASLDQFNTNTFDYNMNRFWWPMLRWNSYMGFQPFRANIITENWNNYVPVKEMQLDNLQWFGFSYYYQPQFSEKELKVIKEGSVVIISSEKKETVSVSGTIKNDKNEVIHGATVTIKGTNKAALTDENGKFKLEYESKKATIEVSFTGHKTLEFDVSGKVVVDVKLGIENAGLDEVVVTGIGNQPMQKSETMSLTLRGNSSLNNQVEMEIEDSESQIFYIARRQQSFETRDFAIFIYHFNP